MQFARLKRTEFSERRRRIPFVLEPMLQAAAMRPTNRATQR
jgi:hypothetical protein